MIGISDLFHLYNNKLIVIIDSGRYLLLFTSSRLSHTNTNQVILTNYNKYIPTFHNIKYNSYIYSIPNNLDLNDILLDI